VVVDAARERDVGQADAASDGGCNADLAADPANCGACDHGCLGGACADGGCQPVVVASGLGDPTGIAVDGERLYWSSPQTGAIHSMGLDGGTRALVVADAGAPHYLERVNDDLYWTDSRATIGSVHARMLPAGTIRSIATKQDHATGITVVGATVYWTLQYIDSIGRSLPDGGVAVTGGACFGEDIAHDATHLFVASPCAGDGILRFELDGTGSMLLAPGNDKEWFAGLALDGDTLYVTRREANRVEKMKKTGGPLEVIAVGQQRPLGIAVDDRAIYWANSGAGTIMRLAK
jgi:sugar lactone lactonase YvrE